jgi:hypothetical protein
MTSCGTGKIPVGASNACCDVKQIYVDAAGAQQCCPSGKLVDGRCSPSGGNVVAMPGCRPGTSDPRCCADGYKAAGHSCCLASQLTSLGVCCPAGQSPSGPNKGQCGPIKLGWRPTGPIIPGGGPSGEPGGGASDEPRGQCCLPGLIPVADGSCCAPERATSLGVCCPAGQRPDQNRCVPSKPPRQSPGRTPGTVQTSPAMPVPSVVPTCPRGTRLIAGSCVPRLQPLVQPTRPPRCPRGTVPNPLGPGCVRPPGIGLPQGPDRPPPALGRPASPPPAVMRPAPAPPPPPPRMLVVPPR